MLGFLQKEEEAVMRRTRPRRVEGCVRVARCAVGTLIVSGSLTPVSLFTLPQPTPRVHAAAGLGMPAFPSF